LEALNAVLQKSMGRPSDVSIFGLFSVPSSIVVSWVVMAFLVISSILLTRNLKKHPSKKQVILEAGIGFFNNICKENLGKHWRLFAPWLGTVALYIFCCNISGLFGVSPPTKDLSITASLALLSFIFIYGTQFWYQGFIGGLKRFLKPFPLLLPINLMEVAIRPIALCMRLFGNMLAGFIVMEMIKCLMPIVVPIPFSFYFDIFDGTLQTVVFIFLTILFAHEGIHSEEIEHSKRNAN
jgi:F-type H+-transporting ATPase subunit a